MKAPRGPDVQGTRSSIRGLPASRGWISPQMLRCPAIRHAGDRGGGPRTGHRGVTRPRIKGASASAVRGGRRQGWSDARRPAPSFAAPPALSRRQGERGPHEASGQVSAQVRGLRQGYPVVVGVDGSDASLAAVRYAVTDAADTGRPLLLVGVVDDPTCRAPNPSSYSDADRDWALLDHLGRKPHASIPACASVAPWSSTTPCAACSHIPVAQTGWSSAGVDSGPSPGSCWARRPPIWQLAQTDR